MLMKRLLLMMLLGVTFLQLSAQELSDTTQIKMKQQTKSAFVFGRAETSVSFKQHEMTPVVSFVTLGIEPVKRLNVGVSYINFLGLGSKNQDGSRLYLKSHGLGGSISWQLLEATGKDGCSETAAGYCIQARYGHSIGNGDLKYNLYDIGLVCYLRVGKFSPSSLTVGYRFIDSRTEGIRNHNGVYLSLGIGL